MLITLLISMLWLCLSGLIYIIIRKKKINLSLRQIMVFFACKIIAGELYGYIYGRYYHGDDTWGLNHDGLIQYKKLMGTPLLFIKEIFSANPYPSDNSYYFQPNGGYLQNLEYCIVTKAISFFDIISQGNYYINIVFFNFFSFWGVYLLYKLVAERLTFSGRQFAAAVLFLFPPGMFWLGGLRAEGLLIFFTGILLYYFKQWLQQRRFADLLLCAAGFAMDFILRDGFAASLVPVLLAWWLAVSYKANTKRRFVIVYCILLVAIITSSVFLPEKFNILSAVAGRQHEFFTLKGNTRFNLTPLDGTVTSFIKVLPESLINTFIRPFPWEAKGMLQWFAVIENICILLLATISVAWFGRGSTVIFTNPLFWVLLIAGISNYIIIGYVVPFPGAIIRYKAIPELLIVGICTMFIAKEIPLRKNYLTTASLHI